MFKQPRGIIPAMLTVFNSDDSIDIKGHKAFAEWLITNKVHGLAACGSTSEAVALTDEERVEIVKATVDQANGRVPVYAGIIHYSTKLAIALAKKCIDVGAESLMVLLPYYYKPTIDAAMDYIRDLSRAIARPVMVYNNPHFAGYELEPSQIKILADEGVVYSVKAAHGDPMRCNYLKHVCGDKITALYGHDYSPLEAFTVGAEGWLSGLPNLVPGLCVELFDAIDKETNLEKARAVWKRMLPIAYYFMYERPNGAPHWLSVFKDGLAMLGIKVGMPRKPCHPLTDAEKKPLRAALAKMYPNVVKA
jgi:4-hydroxy-tetrahydrodipicolinate synthase